jgi:DNA processing protein
MIGIGPAGPRGAVSPATPRIDGHSNAGASGSRAGSHISPPQGRWSSLDLRRLDRDDERPFWIALSALPGVGPVAFARLLARYGSGRAAWAAGPRILELLPRATGEASTVVALLRRRPMTVAAPIEAAVRRAAGRILTALDQDYPAALAALDPRPAVLYIVGETSAVETTCVAVVGTRRPSGYGRACAAEIGDELARAGVTVVSGLALGIDGEAHAAAVAAGGRSVAVLPSPIDRIYPPRHGGLARRMVDAGGALLSEIPPGHAIGRPDFARRNRIIAGLASAVVVVEAPDHSGALLTAAAAVDYGRDLFAVPGPIDAVTSRGCNRLIADHLASLVTSPASLLHQIGATPGTRPLSVANLSDAEGLILGRLLGRPASIEELIDGTGLPTGALASTLTLLEARGLIDSFGGATFHPTLVARRIGHRGQPPQ